MLKKIYTAVVDNIQDGAIIVFHDNNIETVKALKEIISELKAKKYQFVTVSHLLDK